MEKPLQIYIGTAGWSYPDWNGIVYPKSKPRGFSELEYIARYFNVVEVNSTFYKIPTKATVAKWALIKEINPQFKFLVKLWQKFTHAYPCCETESIARFIDSLSPLEKKNFAGLLIQFPWRFKYSAQNMEYLYYLSEAFKQFQLCVEFRHNSWDRNNVLSFFKEQNITFVNIDQPLVSNSISLTKHISSKMAYVRLHGRNRAEWFNEESGRDGRYNYLYNRDELQEWISFIKIAQSTDEVFVIFNNHFRGQAVINALQMSYMLHESKPLAPPSLLRSVPLLGDITAQQLFIVGRAK